MSQKKFNIFTLIWKILKIGFGIPFGFVVIFVWLLYVLGSFLVDAVSDAEDEEELSDREEKAKRRIDRKNKRGHDNLNFIKSYFSSIFS